jgi:hypothetical protein
MAAVLLSPLRSEQQMIRHVQSIRARGEAGNSEVVASTLSPALVARRRFLHWPPSAAWPRPTTGLRPPAAPGARRRKGATTPPWRSRSMTWMPSRRCCPRFPRRWPPRPNHTPGDHCPRLINRLGATSIHWHGVRVPASLDVASPLWSPLDVAMAPLAPQAPGRSRARSPSSHHGAACSANPVQRLVSNYAVGPTPWWSGEWRRRRDSVTTFL